MARSDGPDDEIWGTREELLLACAVSRHGAHSWDSVAVEVRARIPSPRPLTAHTCQRRYRDLQRRFAAEARRIEAADTPGTAEPGGAIPLLEELRRLRVAELRRDVERYDASIVSLQLKVKRLKEDREQGLQGEEPGGEGPDPPEGKKEGGPSESSPEDLSVGRVRGGNSGRSFNESNSPERKGGRCPGTTEERKLATGEKADPVAADGEKVAGEGSCNGSSDTVAKLTEEATPAGEPAAADHLPPQQQPEAGESGESVAESKGGEAGKESSDVQSSAGLSRRGCGRRKAAISGGSSGGEEAEADEVDMRSVAKSGPLSFLEIIRSHRHGSMFVRRLESQDSAGYRSLIRQHMELRTVRSKLAEGAYATEVEFYRDLLLLYTNAVVFFPSSSTEHAAASELRQLVRKQIATAVQKPPPSSPAAPEEPTTLPLPAPKPESDRPTSNPPQLVASRSTVSGKAASKAMIAEEEEEEKPNMEKKEVESVETKEKPAATGLKGPRTSKGRGSSSMKKFTMKPKDVSETTNTERKHNGTNASPGPSGPVAKKRSELNLPTRINRGPPPSKGMLLDRLKTSRKGGKGDGSEQKKRSQMDARKDQGSSRQASAGKHAREQSTPAKRGVGRPPKRPPPPLPPPPAKRAKEGQAGTQRPPPPPPPRAAAVKKRGRK